MSDIQRETEKTDSYEVFPFPKSETIIIEPMEVLLFRLYKLLFCIILILLFLPVVFLSKNKHQNIHPPVIIYPQGNVPSGPVNFTGTGTPHSSVAVDLNNKQVGIGKVSPEGSWSLLTSIPKIGNYTAMVFAIDSRGIRQKGSSPVKFKVISVAVPLQIKQPEISFAPATLRLRGKGTPNSTIVVDLNGQEVGRTNNDSQGTWALPLKNLNAGKYAVTAHMIDVDDKRVESSAPVSFTIMAVANTPKKSKPETKNTLPIREEVPLAATSPKLKPEIKKQILPKPDKPAPPLPTSKPLEPAVKIVQKPTSVITKVTTPVIEPVKVVVEPVTQQVIAKKKADPSSYIPKGSLEIRGYTSLPSGLTQTAYSWSGTGKPGSTVHLSVDSTEITTGNIESDGKWSVKGYLSLAPGSHSFTATISDGDQATLTELKPRDITIPETLTLDKVEFEKTKNGVLPSGKEALQSIIVKLSQNPDAHVIINGHTDWNGKQEFNQRLSEKRAETVRQYLIEQGISADRLSARGYGETRPLVDNKTPENRRRNRRVEFVFLKGQPRQKNPKTFQQDKKIRPKPAVKKQEKITPKTTINRQRSPVTGNTSDATKTLKTNKPSETSTPQEKTSTQAAEKKTQSQSQETKKLSQQPTANTKKTAKESKADKEKTPSKKQKSLQPIERDAAPTKITNSTDAEQDQPAKTKINLPDTEKSVIRLQTVKPETKKKIFSPVKTTGKVESTAPQKRDRLSTKAAVNTQKIEPPDVQAENDKQKSQKTKKISSVKTSDKPNSPAPDDKDTISSQSIVGAKKAEQSEDKLKDSKKTGTEVKQQESDPVSPSENPDSVAKQNKKKTRLTPKVDTNQPLSSDQKPDDKNTADTKQTQETAVKTKSPAKTTTKQESTAPKEEDTPASPVENKKQRTKITGEESSKDKTDKITKRSQKTQKKKSRKIKVNNTKESSAENQPDLLATPPVLPDLPPDLQEDQDSEDF